MESARIPHDFLSLPFEIYALVVFGVLLSALFMYLMRLQDRANAENKHIKTYLDPYDFFAEVIFAAATGFSFFGAALWLELEPIGVVMMAHGGAYLNRPIYLLINRHGGAILEWALKTKIGITLVANDEQNESARDAKIAALETEFIYETRSEEKLRIRRLLDELKRQ